MKFEISAKRKLKSSLLGLASQRQGACQRRHGALVTSDYLEARRPPQLQLSSPLTKSKGGGVADPLKAGDKTCCIDSVRIVHAESSVTQDVLVGGFVKMPGQGT